MATREQYILSIPVSGNTPYGYFDDKTTFIADAQRFAVYARITHGSTHIGVELDDLDLLAAYEEATMEYSSIVNAHQARNTLADFLGIISPGNNTPTSSNHFDAGTVSGLENKFPAKTMALFERYSQATADQVGVSTSYRMHTGTIRLSEGKQRYNLLTDLTGTAGVLTSVPTIMEVFHEPPFYGGVGTYAASVYYQREMGGGAFPLGTMFGLFPMWPQMLYGMNMEMSSKLRRSWHSYAIYGQELWVFPVPADNTIRTVRVHYATDRNNPLPASGSAAARVTKISHFAEAPYSFLDYQKLNSFSRNWIRSYAFASTKERLGLKRSKFDSIPYVQGNMTLNGPELMNQSADEKKTLVEQLQATLDNLLNVKLLEEEAKAHQSTMDIADDMPFGFMIG